MIRWDRRICDGWQRVFNKDPNWSIAKEDTTIRDHLESVYNEPAWVDEFNHSNFEAPQWPTKKRKRETTTRRGNLVTPPNSQSKSGSNHKVRKLGQGSNQSALQTDSKTAALTQKPGRFVPQTIPKGAPSAVTEIGTEIQDPKPTHAQETGESILRPHSNAAFNAGTGTGEEMVDKINSGAAASFPNPRHPIHKHQIPGDNDNSLQMIVSAAASLEISSAGSIEPPKPYTSRGRSELTGQCHTTATRKTPYSQLSIVRFPCIPSDYY